MFIHIYIYISDGVRTNGVIREVPRFPMNNCHGYLRQNCHVVFNKHGNMCGVCGTLVNNKSSCTVWKPVICAALELKGERDFTMFTMEAPERSRLVLQFASH